LRNRAISHILPTISVIKFISLFFILYFIFVLLIMNVKDGKKSYDIYILIDPQLYSKCYCLLYCTLHESIKNQTSIQNDNHILNNFGIEIYIS